MRKGFWMKIFVVGVLSWNPENSVMLYDVKQVLPDRADPAANIMFSPVQKCEKMV